MAIVSHPITEEIFFHYCSHRVIAKPAILLNLLGNDLRLSSEKRLQHFGKKIVYIKLVFILNYIFKKKFILVKTTFFLIQL